jgi:hypothetical protein
MGKSLKDQLFTYRSELSQRSICFIALEAAKIFLLAWTFFCKFALLAFRFL